jgi:hypothetical protein
VLNQQQAFFIAGQLEPEATAQAKSASASYVLLNYSATNTSSVPIDLHNTPAWMVWYQKIPQAVADSTVDATPPSAASHDLYVFLNADDGKELLVIWV